MERFTAYESALHAAHVALQLYWGVDRAIALIEPYWDIPRRPDICPAHTLADILIASGLPAKARLLPVAHLLASVSQVAFRGEFSTFETRRAAPARDRRWGLLMGETERIWKWAECVGPGEVVVTPARPEDTLTGWYVHVQRALPINGKFFARDAGAALPLPSGN